nr:MAG TPA: hypothetical protein [Caudoviricetes sp.]
MILPQQGRKRKEQSHDRVNHGTDFEENKGGKRKWKSH